MPAKASKIVNVAIGVLVRKSGGAVKILIARRPEDTVYAGYWEFPGGKVDEGETQGACLAREFHEELGIEVCVGEALGVIEHVYDHAHVRLHPFYCDPNPREGGGEPQNLQVAEHRWIAPAELPDYRFPEANGALIARVMADFAG